MSFTKQQRGNRAVKWRKLLNQKSKLNDKTGEKPSSHHLFFFPTLDNRHYIFISLWKFSEKNPFLVHSTWKSLWLPRILMVKPLVSMKFTWLIQVNEKKKGRKMFHVWIVLGWYKQRLRRPWRNKTFLFKLFSFFRKKNYSENIFKNVTFFLDPVLGSVLFWQCVLSLRRCSCYMLSYQFLYCLY